MTRFVPPAATLLQATADYLEQELLPTLTGYHRFQTRISVNALQTVTRELQLAAGHEAAELARLAALLRRDAPLAELNNELIDKLTHGDMPLDAPDLLDHLRATLNDALTINSPRWTKPHNADK